MNTTDDDFSQLSTRLRRRIDALFSKFSLSSSSGDAPPPAKKQKLDPEPNDGFGGGGFVRDGNEENDTGGGFVSAYDGDTAMGGGFVRDDVDVEMEVGDTSEGKRIPLSKVPAALQRLDLPPDDPEILAVFKNAASGWSASGPKSNSSEQEQGVNRKDWRAVCAVLLSQRPDEAGALYDSSVGGTDDDMEDQRGYGSGSVDEGVVEEEDAEESDEYREESGSENDSEDEARPRKSDDEEYAPPTTRRAAATAGASTSTAPSKPPPKSKYKRRPKRARARSDSASSASESGAPRPLTARQKRECRLAFALFFPDVGPGDEALLSKRIMIRDITVAAKTLKEKITAEETIEMLETFSTSRDKSMGLADFERMMMVARLA